MEQLILIYITCPNRELAGAIAELLLKERLIACASFAPAQSMFWWNNAITSEAEYILIAKSASRLFNRIVQAVTAVHPYEIPCILSCEITANESFGNWVEKEVTT